MQLIGTLSGLAVIAVAVFTVNNQLNNQERMAAERSASALQLEEQRVASEAENFAEDRRRETERFHEQAFRSYLETMTRLILDNGLSEAASEDPVTQIARAQTIDVLRQLDADRNGLLIQFLKNSRLIRSTGLTESPGGIINLSAAILSGANLSGVDLSNIDLSGVDLRGANLSGANLSSTDLSNATLGGSIKSLNLADCSVEVDSSGPANANLSGATFHNTNLSGADLSGVTLNSAILTDVNLDGADLVGAQLQDVKMKGAKLRDAYLMGSDLRGADPGGADLNGAGLCGANLSGANLSDQYACVGWATPRIRARQAGADLRGTDLTKADLTNADMTKADLTAADLTDASLFRADFTNAILRHAIINHEQLSQANEISGAPIGVTWSDSGPGLIDIFGI